jgi:hypothetical protein
MRWSSLSRRVWEPPALCCTPAAVGRCSRRAVASRWSRCRSVTRGVRLQAASSRTEAPPPLCRCSWSATLLQSALHSASPLGAHLSLQPNPCSALPPFAAARPAVEPTAAVCSRMAASAALPPLELLAERTHSSHRRRWSCCISRGECSIVAAALLEEYACGCGWAHRGAATRRCCGFALSSQRQWHARGARASRRCTAGAARGGHGSPHTFAGARCRCVSRGMR